MSSFARSITTTLQIQTQTILRNRAGAFLILTAFAIALYTGYCDERSAQAVAYLFAVWLCAFVTDMVIAARPSPAIGFPVKRPSRLNLLQFSDAHFSDSAFSLSAIGTVDTHGRR